MARPAPYYAEIDGKKTRVPSVTTICGKFKDSGALIWWANAVGLGERDCDDQEECPKCGRRPGKTHREAMQKAADVGTYAHALIERQIKRVDFDERDFEHLTDEQLLLAQDSMDAFDSWWSHADIEVIETELRLVSEAHRFGGTFDCLARVRGRVSLIDWKTSRGIYADYLAQLGGYALLIEENGFPPIEELHILRISKETAGFEHRMLPRGSFQPAIDYFLKARELYDLVKPMEKMLK